MILKIPQVFVVNCLWYMVVFFTLPVYKQFKKRNALLVCNLQEVSEMV